MPHSVEKFDIQANISLSKTQNYVINSIIRAKHLYLLPIY